MDNFRYISPIKCGTNAEQVKKIEKYPLAFAITKIHPKAFPAQGCTYLYSY